MLQQRCGSRALCLCFAATANGAVRCRRWRATGAVNRAAAAATFPNLPAAAQPAAATLPGGKRRTGGSVNMQRRRKATPHMVRRGCQLVCLWTFELLYVPGSL